MTEPVINTDKLVAKRDVAGLIEKLRIDQPARAIYD